MTRNAWTETELKRLEKFVRGGLSDREISRRMNRSLDSVMSKRARHVSVPKSSMPLWNKPLESQGDFLVLSDIEAPYQHSDFINRCIDLAYRWNIKIVHLAGDLLHYDSLSAWGSEWTESTEELSEKLFDFIATLDGKSRDSGLQWLEENFSKGGYSSELKEARKVFKAFDIFENVLVELGNHDDRYLRTLNQVLEVTELLHQLDQHHNPRWKIAPYYYAIAHTEQGDYRITHPRGAGRTAAQDLAVQFHTHIIMGHSHRWSVNRDPSSRYWAIQTGCCVDEMRLPYVMQRDAKRDAHLLGATIVRGGYPFVLSPETPFDLLAKL